MMDVEYLGNENLICHVWDNLISNAIKFSPCGGTIYIRMMPEGEKIRFSIENEGPQISEYSMKHIFDKFYQGDSSHKQEGNGLGLALVKQILNLCKGTVSWKIFPEAAVVLLLYCKTNTLHISINPKNSGHLIFHEVLPLFYFI